MCVRPLIDSTLELHKRSIGYLLPTPAKSHYLFNLRDFSKVIQVILPILFKTLNSAKNVFDCYCVRQQGLMFSVPATVDNTLSMKRLWVHEILRVYYDRLVDESDRSWFFETLSFVCKEILGDDINEMFVHLTTEQHKTVTLISEGFV